MWHWKRQTLISAAALATFAGSAAAQFPTTTDTETFDTYTVGQLDGQGNWAGWDGANTSFANVSTDFARSAPHSAKMEAGADSVNDSMNMMYDDGQWSVETWCYFPSGFIGKSYFITLNSYVDGGPYEWNGQVGFNGDSGRMECDCADPGGLTVDRVLVYDQWVDLRFDFDFDADLVDVYFNTAAEATPIASYIISGGVFGTNSFLDVRLQAIDLYPDGVGFPNVTEIYFDDISIKPTAGGPPGTPMCFGDGTGTPCACGNPGGSGEGCANSTGTGATISGSGTASLSADSLVIQTTGIPNSPGLTFQANNLLGSPPSFGDGIRCCGGNVVRWITIVAQGNCAATDLSCGTQVGGLGGSIAAHPGNTSLMAGDSRCYQHWYRDPGASNPCGVDFFNLSPAYVVDWGA